MTAGMIRLLRAQSLYIPLSPALFLGLVLVRESLGCVRRPTESLSGPATMGACESPPSVPCCEQIKGALRGLLLFHLSTPPGQGASDNRLPHKMGIA